MVVSKTLTKNLVLGIDNFSSKMVPNWNINFFFVSEVMPPMDIISAYAAASLFLSNDMGTDPFNITITNCKNKKTNFKFNTNTNTNTNN